MDPITAVGLAASIFTFIDFSWSLVTGAKELHQSGLGTTKENARIGSIISDLKEYSLGLATSGSEHENFRASKHGKALGALADKCCLLSDDLEAILSRLKTTKNSRWQSLKTTWASMRKQGEIKSIEYRLGEYRSQMQSRLLAMLSDQNSSIKLQLDNLQERAERVSTASAEGMQQMRKDLIDYLSDLKLDSSASDTSEDEGDTGQVLLFQSLDEIKARLSSLETIIRSTERHTRILQHLYFDAMFVREDSIDDASSGTFSWILANQDDFKEHVSVPFWSAQSIYTHSNGLYLVPADAGTSVEATEQSLSRRSQSLKKRMGESRELLLAWLREGSGVFHVSGKAGSGKSTFIKLVSNHPLTVESLQHWSKERTLITASFYFWNSGVELQTTLQGFHRSILFRVLRQHPDLIPMVFPVQWKKLTLNTFGGIMETDLFRQTQIKEALDLLMNQVIDNSTTSLCLFIDGLDELGAHPFDHKRLSIQLREWARSPHVKICVSSRPYVEFLDTFSPTQRINLHELTTIDISHFAREMFEGDENFPRVESIYLSLIDEILDMADGVFLWARLVVKSIISEVGLHASHDRLRQKLRDTPREMDALYEKMLSSLSRADRTRANMLLLLALTNPFEELQNAICFPWIDAVARQGFPSIQDLAHINSEQDILQCVEAANRQIAGLTSGLLSVTSNIPIVSGQPGLYFACRIQFFHQTVRDYLETPTRKNQFATEFPDFDPYAAHSLLRMAEVALACQRTFSFSDFARWSYGLDLLSIKAQPGLDGRNYSSQAHSKPYQQPYPVMKLYRELCAKYFRSRYFKWPQMFEDFIPLFEEQASFVHLAAAHRQTDYLGEVFAKGVDLDELEGSMVCAKTRSLSKGSIEPIQASSLFLSACYKNFDQEIFSLLLAQQLPTSFRLRLFDSNAEPRDSTVSFWLILVGLVTSYTLQSLPEHNMISQAFGILEQILQVAEQDPVLIVICEKGGSEIDRTRWTITLYDLVLVARPKNTQRLLELLSSNKWGRFKTDLVSKDWEPTKIHRLPALYTLRADALHGTRGLCLDSLITDNCVVNARNTFLRIW